jgi:hypothetical protein
VESGGTKYSWRQAERSLNLLFEKTSHAFNVEQCNGLSLEPIATAKTAPRSKKSLPLKKWPVA